LLRSDVRPGLVRGRRDRYRKNFSAVVGNVQPHPQDVSVRHRRRQLQSGGRLLQIRRTVAPAAAAGVRHAVVELGPVAGVGRLDAKLARNAADADGAADLADRPQAERRFVNVVDRVMVDRPRLHSPAQLFVVGQKSTGKRQRERRFAVERRDEAGPAAVGALEVDRRAGFLERRLVVVAEYLSRSRTVVGGVVDGDDDRVDPSRRRPVLEVVQLRRDGGANLRIGELLESSRSARSQAIDFDLETIQSRLGVIPSEKPR